MWCSFVAWFPENRNIPIDLYGNFQSECKLLFRSEAIWRSCWLHILFFILWQEHYGTSQWILSFRTYRSLTGWCRHIHTSQNHMPHVHTQSAFRKSFYHVKCSVSLNSFMQFYDSMNFIVYPIGMHTDKKVIVFLVKKL